MCLNTKLEKVEKIKKNLGKYSIEQLKNHIKSYSGGHLPNGYSRLGSLSCSNGISYLKSVFASALAVINEGKKPSDDVLNKANRIIGAYCGGDNSYIFEDVKVCYGYLTLYRKLEMTGFWSQ